MAQEATELEWCPNCGEGVEKLNPLTGFCSDCSYSATGKRECERCGREFTPYQNSRTKCNSCLNEEWLGRNADSIERVMAHYGSTDVLSAIQLVYDDNRPRCVMCGDKLKHGTRGRTVFCNKRDECRRASIRYHNYRKRNGMSAEAALERAIHGKGRISGRPEGSSSSDGILE